MQTTTDKSLDSPFGSDWSDSFASEIAAQSEPRKKPGKVSPAEIADMTAQLAIMTRSGVDVASALQSLKRQCRRPALAEILTDIHDSVIGGVPFSQALRNHEKVFGATYIATVASGEASGSMSNVLAQLAQLQRSELRLTRTVKSLLAYPVLLASVSSLVMLALILFVLPQFADIFKQYDTPLPTLTQILLWFANELRTRWWIYLPLTVATIGGGLAFRLHPKGRRIFDKALISIPLVRDVSRTLIVGRACRLMGMMVESGVPILESLRLVRRAMTNTYYRELFDTLEDDVLNGRGLATSLTESDIIPPAASEMIATAEKSGNLGEVTRLMGEHFEEEGEARMRQIVAVIEPIITVGMGLVVAIVVMAVMLPMFDLATFANH